MDKEIRTETELETINESEEALDRPEALTPENDTPDAVTRLSLPQGDEHHSTPAAPAWTDEADFEPEEQAIQGSDELSADADSGAGGTALEPLRKYALWVTLALFLLFPTYFTLGLLGLALALHTARFLQIVRGLRLEHWGYVAITLLGTGLRFWDLGLKPLHHDESMHAYFSWQLFLDPASYQYNPLLHGPFQFHAIAYV